MGLTTHFCISANFNKPWSLNKIPNQSLSKWVLVQNANYLSLTFNCYTCFRCIFTLTLFISGTIMVWNGWGFGLLKMPFRNILPKNILLIRSQNTPTRKCLTSEGEKTLLFKFLYLVIFSLNKITSLQLWNCKLGMKLGSFYVTFFRFC